MSKVLPLERWKKQPMPEREAFSDEESDEEDSEYEEVVIPKAKKRKLKGEKSNAKRIKLNPNPLTPKKQEPRAIPIKKASKKRPGLRKLCQDLLLASLQSGSNQINRSPHPSLLEYNSRGDQLYTEYCFDYTV